MIAVGKKKQQQEEFMKLPHRRAHSKNDKYPLDEGSHFADQEDSLDMQQHMSTHTQQNFLVQNSFEKQQNS